jgi:hypothetical protein
VLKLKVGVCTHETLNKVLTEPVSPPEKSRRSHRITPSEPIWENRDFFCEILVFARRPGPSGIVCTPQSKGKKRKTHMGSQNNGADHRKS